MKKFLASILATTLLVSMMVVPTYAAKATTRTYTLDPLYIESLAGEVKVRVTVNGYLGALDMAECGIENELYRTNGWMGIGDPAAADDPRDIMVVKSGSEIKFTITASNPDAYYNYCYTKGVKALEEKAAAEGNTYPAIFDDCGGGVMYTMEDGNLSTMPLFVLPNDDGTARMTAGGFRVAEGKKISSNTYVYTAHDGLFGFAFQGKDTQGDPVMDSYGYMARYALGTFLFVTDEQIEQLKKEGIMTFHENLDNEFVAYDHVYPGLAEVLGVEVAKTMPDLYIEEQGLWDPYAYTVKNVTGKEMNGYYALLSYWDTTSYYPANEMKPWETEYFLGQVMPFDLELAPGASVKGECWPTRVGWSTMKHIWIKFDDKEERDAFFVSGVLTLESAEYDPVYEIDMGIDGIQWMKDTFGISIKSGRY